MIKEATRHIKLTVERELWARAAGRCQFDGCNRLLYQSPVTQERVNISEKAHIYAFSEDGPRGWGPLAENTELLNEISNLLLACHDCHKTIDADQEGERYSAELLRRWKAEHEKRIAIVTGIRPTKKSHVVMYGANIGDQTSKLQFNAAASALFPDWYPASERPTEISMTWEGRDSDPGYWITESNNLRATFNSQLRPIVDSDYGHLSLFSLAPIPLMILFGSLLTDKVSAQTYQLHREPSQTWSWQCASDSVIFEIVPPVSSVSSPALVLSLSDRIEHARVTDVLGEAVSIWELRIPSPHNDFLKTKDQLSEFRRTVRQLMVEIGKVHGKRTPLSIFPAMPVACAVDFGRVRMPKADNPLVIYDQNNLHGKFVRALEIN